MTNQTLRNDGAQATLFRNAPPWEGRKTAAIGAFRCDDAQAGSSLLNDAADLLRAEGYQAMIGPMDGDTWHSYRLITETDDSPPFLMEPKSAPHDLDAFQKAGFEEISSYFSARGAVAGAIGTPPPHDDAIEIRQWDGTNPEACFADVHSLSTKAFANNLFYAPISLESFLAMYMPFVPMLKPELILMARDTQSGALLGFLFGIPNYQEGLTPSSVILKTYASLRAGVGHHLSHVFHQNAQTMGYEHVIHALIHDSNQSADRSRKHGAQVFRRYALLGRVLNA
ncbi:hypothetical protein [Actibacterium lipolyticum]|uniref:N-acetyltransferase domain-containing protein n=1 Tax=Actibacterium lipolyticum TaxID=1524263 RepID=A0A238KS79_9RHOB|nr:hypothetical protein [Actibacterium lipolyticum]SMX45694.1 hypothetical protein COL8621_02867 [Actibacterium lipolyticum]